MNAKRKKHQAPPPGTLARNSTFHRELSWLAFNERVLGEAVTADNPPAERLRFVAIAANNLDEFGMVRAAGLRRLTDAGYDKPDEYGWRPAEIVAAVNPRVRALVARMYEVYGRNAADLAAAGIRLKTWEILTPRQRKAAQQHFDSTIFPVMTPMAVDQGHPFPVLPSRTISFVLRVKRAGAVSLAILPVPTVVPRVLALPAEGAEQDFILIDEIIGHNLEAFFKGYTLAATGMFRIIRDSEIEVDEEFTEDLLQAIERGVRQRPRGRAVWLEVRQGLPEDLVAQLAAEFDIPPEEVFHIPDHLDLTFLFQLIGQAAGPALCYPAFRPAAEKHEDIFARIRKGAFLVHCPFQAIDPVVDLVRAAARDPRVLAIKMTLYRTGGDSSFIKALKAAARAGKQVTVLVEIKARFEEEKNILWARELEEAGCHVIYGIPGIKIHSKIACVVRREEEGIRRYIHLGTGNYNEYTARVYTDIGCLTADEDTARDVGDIFNVISGYSAPPAWKTVITAPNDLRDFFYHLIDTEVQHQAKYGNGAICAKLNAIADAGITRKLYEASRAGVRIRLIVRGICCLMPGVPDQSPTIAVRSIVGRFLEHTRIFSFHNNGDERVFISSADWMTRNFDRRIELLFNVKEPALRKHLAWLLETYWQDNTKSHVLRPDGTYVPHRTDAPPFNAQAFLIDHYGTERRKKA